MQDASRQFQGILASHIILLAVLGWLAGPAHGDPLIEHPDARTLRKDSERSEAPERPDAKGALAEHEDGSTRLALVAEVDVLAVLGSDTRTTYPDVGRITGNEPELAVARVGLVGLEGVLAYVARVDTSEAVRLDLDTLEERPVATLDAFLDDAALWWSPRVWASFVAGRVVVPFSAFRMLERASLTTGAAPFVVDRVAPDRRWGATFFGDLGAMSYAAGAYADPDALELRNHERASGVESAPDEPSVADLAVLDPSTSGRAAVAAYVGWTPRAPLGPDHMATPASDPWYDTVRPGAGLGLLWRSRDGDDRLDVSLSGRLVYRSVAVMAEILAHAQTGDAGLGVAGQASLLFTEKAYVYALGEYDDELALFTAGGGLGFFATRDRRSKVVLAGWLRRDRYGDTQHDGVVVHLQAVL